MSSSITATGNWWGSPNGPTTPQNTFASSGTGDVVSGSASLAPWYTSGAATSQSPGWYPATTPTANTLDTAPPVVTTSTQAATESAPATLSLGSVTDADGSLPSGQYTVTVNWGDQSSPYSFSITPSDPTSFSLGALTHTYTEYGPYTATVTVVDNAGNSSGPQSFTVNVADAALTGATGVNVGALAGVAFTNVPVATFTDQAGSDSNPNDLSATIDWGDGQPGSPDTSAGTLVEQGNTGVYTVEGSHTYAAAGSDAITVTINDKGGQTTTATAAATVGNTVWVSGNWVDDTNPAGPLTAGDTVAAPTGETAPNLGSGTLIYGVNAFSTIQDGVTNVDTGGTVYVLPGTYVENVTISKPLTLSGAGQTGSSATTIIPSFAGAVGGSTFAAGCTT